MVIYQVMPNLMPEEYEALKADIAQQGVLVPIEVDEDGNILDGHHRVRACKELGIRKWPRLIRPNLSENEKRAYARKLNTLRRHLTLEQKHELIRQQLRETPEKSDNLLATLLGVTDKTIRSVREDMEATSEFPKLARLVGADGKERPRQMERERSTIVLEENSFTTPNYHTEQLPLTTLAVHFSSTSIGWYTPVHIVKRIVRVLDTIDLDPCSNSHTNPIIPAINHYTAEDDGLNRSWKGRIYMNPPYGRDIGQWIDKLCHEWRIRAVTAALALVPARTDTTWFRQLRDFPVCFLNGRLKFNDQENSAPFPSAVFYLGRRLNHFVITFSDVGDIYSRIGA